MDFYKQADLIIQDCETTPFKSGVHANYSELVTLPLEIKTKMMLLHYQDILTVFVLQPSMAQIPSTQVQSMYSMSKTKYQKTFKDIVCQLD